MCTLGSIAETNLNAIKIQTESDEELGVLPIQDYLLSSDEEIDLKVEVNSPLIDKIVEGDKIVDELDALTSKRQLKRPLPPHRDLSEPSTSTAASTLAATTTIDRQEYKKRKLEKKEKRWEMIYTKHVKDIGFSIIIFLITENPRIKMLNIVKIKKNSVAKSLVLLYII